MEQKQRIDEMIEKTISTIKSMIDFDYIVGKAIKNDFGDTVIPISKITVGFIAGGGEYSSSKRHKKCLNDDNPFYGGIGSGCTILPMGFLVVSKDNVHYINTSGENTLTKILDLATKFYQAYKKD